jgi:hypothetical protein
VTSGRRTNLALGILLGGAVLTGLASNTIGVDWPFDLAMFHGVMALAILGLAPWKSLVIRRGLRRQRRGSWTSLVLMGLTLTALSTGILHTTGLATHIGPLTVMQVHVGAALVALAMAVQHYLRHPVQPRATDVDRRSLLRAAVLASAAGVGWLGWQQTLRALAMPGADRRFTGSHERGSGDPGALPVTSWFDDRIPGIDPDDWRVDVAGESWSLDSIGGEPHERFDALLDCTGGWYSIQTWDGVRLDHLLEAGDWRSFEVRSATGYSLLFPMRDVSKVYLVTALGGEPLSPGHGFPARIVAPGRRGFWWVKWVVSIQPSTRPWWLQSPFPLT